MMDAHEVLSESWAIALRDLKKGSSLLKQLVFIILIVAVILLIGEAASKITIMPFHGQTYNSFFSSGMVAYLIAVAALGTGSELVTDRKGFGKLLLIAPVSRISILLGKMIYTIIGSMKAYFVMSLLIMLYLKTFNVLRLLILSLIVICIVLTFLGIAFIISAFVKKPKTAGYTIGYLSMAFLFLSGIIYPVQSLPKLFEYLTYLNPMTYAADAVRYAITGNSAFPPTLLVPVMITLATILPVIGTHFYDRKLRN